MSYFRNIKQDVQSDANNTSSTNLAVGNSYTFTGTGTSTLGIAGIQIALFADKNCKVQIQQSNSQSSNWDIVDTYYYTASATNFGVTVQAIMAYYRVVVTTNSQTTTTFRVASTLCPIVEAIPRTIDENQNFKVAMGMDEYGWNAENTPMGDQRVVTPFRLVGTTFEGSTIDSNFWTTGTTGGGTAAVTQGNAQMLLTSGTANPNTAYMYSVRRARYVGGSGMRYRAVVQPSAGVANNVRRWGIGYGASLPTITDGAWFEFSGTTFQLKVMKGGSPTTIATTDFNGHLGAWSPTADTATTMEIYWTNTKVYFTAAGDLLHIHTASTATWANTMNFHVFADSTNSGVLGADATLAVRVATIYRLGEYRTQPNYKNITGSGTQTLKFGPGVLHRVILNNPVAKAIILYDNIAASGTIIATITPQGSSPPVSIEFQSPYYTGLTIDTTAGAQNVTVVNE